MPRTPGAKERLRQFLRQRVGQIVTVRQLQRAAGDVTEWARRVRELRNDEGWQIATHNDDSTLKPGEYRLDKAPPEGRNYSFSKPISSRLRAQVLDRNGHTCQMCGAGAGETDQRGRPIRLHIGHVIDRIHGGKDTLDNLKALCAECNQGAKNLTNEPPRWVWLKSQLRRASNDDQRKALEWLQDKFSKGGRNQ